MSRTSCSFPASEAISSRVRTSRARPNLVVEILDPPTAERDLTVKLDLYVRHGVKEYWIADPDAGALTVLLRGESGFDVVSVYGEGQTLHSPTLRGFNVALGAVF